MPRFPTVLFDLDGTLIDSIRLILDSYHHTLAVHGIPARGDQHWLRGVGTPLRAQFAEFAGDPPLLEALVATYREFNLANHDRMVTRYDGVLEMLDAVRATGARLGIVTSKNREGTLRGLRLVGLADHFDVLVCADDVTRPKPDREPVDKAVSQLSGTAAGTLFVGDSIHDLHAGRAAGVSTGAVLWGPFGRPDLAPATPDYWFERPGDLLPLLAGGGYLAPHSTQP